jgi:hypothetical protein
MATVPQILAAEDSALAQVEAKLPAGAPKISGMLNNLFAALPHGPNLPIGTPPVPAIPSGSVAQTITPTPVNAMQRALPTVPTNLTASILQPSNLQNGRGRL